MTTRIKLEGKKIGKLYVKEYIGGGKYHCICECKNECDVFSDNLIKGHTKSCGCQRYSSDLAGKTIGAFDVIERSESQKRGKNKRVMWKCRCRICGKIVDIYADCLERFSSCGCAKNDKDISEKLRAEFVEGTQISKIKPKISKANKSGVVGVNWDKSRGKWQASIRFKGHKYNIGRFANFDDACKARKEAEKELFGNFLEWYNSRQSPEQ